MFNVMSEGALLGQAHVANFSKETFGAAAQNCLPGTEPGPGSVVGRKHPSPTEGLEQYVVG